MNLVKPILAAALALSLAACHEPGHPFCDRDNDGEADVACIGLLVGVGKVVLFAAASSSNRAER